MIDAAGEGTLKALYIVGENPCLSDPDAGHVRSSLAALDFLVVQDLFLTETAQLADLVLPAASFAEKDGHFTNTERRVQRLRRALEPPGEALEDGDIITRLAARLGGDWPPFDPRNVHAEIQNLVPSYSGISRARTARRGVQWPAPAGRGGTPILHVDAFPSGKAPFAVVDWSAPDEPPDRTYPFRLTTGRLLAQFHTGTMTRRIPGLESMAKPMVAVSPQDASRLGLSEGDSVRVSTRRGSVTVPAAISPGLPVGLLFMPFHFHESPANELTNPARDAEAGIPELKICAARLSRAPRKKQA
jgi:predicted molibdopterin-dependent oxidoreductase YjgC